MGISCKLFGHKWDGCKCSRCGEIRDEQHDWDLCKGVCKRCRKIQPEQHDWNGCKCSRCGKTRDERHDWDLCKGKCNRCGKTQTEQHDWDGCKCSRCGKENHVWEGDSCKNCGIPKPKKYKYMGREEGVAYINEMSASDLIDLIQAGEEYEPGDLTWLCSRMAAKLIAANEAGEMWRHQIPRDENQNIQAVEKALRTFGNENMVINYRKQDFHRPDEIERAFTQLMLDYASRRSRI